QFTAAGKQMAGMELMSYQQGVLMGAVLIGIYVLIGGYAAVCWTDLIQGLLMLAVLITFPIYAVIQAGGFGAVGEALHRANIDHWWVGGQGPTTASVGFALTYFGFGLGYPGMPHSIIRFITVRDEKEAAHAAWIGAIYGALVLFGSASLGIAGRALVTGLADAEQILPSFTATYFPPLLGGVILAAVSAAIMSTADSQLMMAASALVHDLFFMSFKQHTAPSGKVMTRATRGVIALLCALALGLALMEAKVIDTMVLFAWGCLGAAFSPVVMLALYWERFNWQGAVTSFLVGPITVIIWQLMGLSGSLHGLIPGTGLSLVAAVVVSMMTPPRVARPAH
ncbi:MAG: hypothetical protein JRH20_30660, partial [Deltaproteobacteria bacterium]|nr:hypothetical protein [Deltaproteobacteria bacterium]